VLVALAVAQFPRSKKRGSIEAFLDASGCPDSLHISALKKARLH